MLKTAWLRHLFAKLRTFPEPALQESVEYESLLFPLAMRDVVLWSIRRDTDSRHRFYRYADVPGVCGKGMARNKVV
jgi:hypothetical protein